MKKSLLLFVTLLISACFQNTTQTPSSKRIADTLPPIPISDGPKLGYVANGQEYKLPKQELYSYFDTTDDNNTKPSMSDVSTPTPLQFTRFFFHLPDWRSGPKEHHNCEHAGRIDGRSETWPKPGFWRNEACRRSLINFIMSPVSPGDQLVVGDPKKNNQYLYEFDFINRFMSDQIPSPEPLYGLVRYANTIDPNMPELFYKSSMSSWDDWYFHPSKEKPTSILICTGQGLPDLLKSKTTFYDFASCRHLYFDQQHQVVFAMHYHRQHLPQWRQIEQRLTEWLEANRVKSS